MPTSRATIAPCLLALALALLGGSLASARSAHQDVAVRGTYDGAFVRIPDVAIDQCTLSQPDSRRFVVEVRDAALRTHSSHETSEWIERLRVLGPDLVGGGQSRLVIQVTSSTMTARLQPSGEDVLLVLSGAARLQRDEPVEAVDAKPEREPRRSRRNDADDAVTAGAETAPPAPSRRRERVQRPAPGARVEGAAGEEAPKEPREQQPRPRVAERRAERAPRRASMPTHVEALAPDTMVNVPAGQFLMGTMEGDGFADESPQHPVDLPSFTIDTHELTLEDWRRSPLQLPQQPAWNEDPRDPVVNVTWHEAAEYCEWAGKRLPTEAEWEKAARGSEAPAYPWGSAWSAGRVNSGVDGDGFEHLAPVGSFPEGASPSGALDMAGNAWEWVADWYGRDAYEHAERRSPRGPAKGSHKVVRGGSFRGPYSVNVRAAVRLPLQPSSRRDDVGFRCAD